MSHIIRSKLDLKKAIKEIKEANSTIGLVPTMGSLHQGHLSLVQSCKKMYDISIVSIFVNPTQFNNPDDLLKYPRSEADDIKLLRNENCDIIFIPSIEEMYEDTSTIKLDFGYLDNIMEGCSRPGHFNGVGLVVMKLFGLTAPTGAFFGQKDLQQFKIIESLVEDFSLPITLHMAPVIREKSMLAMSSRNQRLAKEDKLVAANIYKALQKAKTLLENGSQILEVKKRIGDFFLSINGIELEYFEITAYKTLKNISVVNAGDRLALCIVAHVANVRLIDNLIIQL